MLEDLRPASLDEIGRALDDVDATQLLFALHLRRTTGRLGYSLRCLWRAYLASFLLNLPHTNALIRRLEDDPALRHICGFGKAIPGRRTFNRFILRLSEHTEDVETALASLTDRLKKELPDLGDTVAIDSTVVRTHGNPNRKILSDPEVSCGRCPHPRGGEPYSCRVCGYMEQLSPPAWG